jgi:N-glycosylase/DNA lyase
MDFTYATQEGRDVMLSGVKNFALAQTLDNGQAFRWREVSPNEFTGIAHGRRLVLVFSENILTLKNVSLEEFETLWKKYFDFQRDYGELKSIFAKSEGVLREALNFSPGLRLMRQDVWEVLVSFILSQNSNIPRIKKMIELLCENFGDKLSSICNCETDACQGYAFPSAEVLAKLSADELAPIKCGYRAAYVIDAAHRVASGQFEPSVLEKLSSDEIKNELLQIHGVGPKVADCVLLYGFGRTECYPADVWIKRVMTKYYPDGFPKELNEHAGIAQQFLFHYVRNAAIVF